MSKSSVFDQLVQEGGNEGNEISFLDDDRFYVVYPFLHDVLFAKKAFGKPREPGRLAIFHDEGKVKVCITCPSEGVCAFLTLKILSDLCPALEKGLAEGTLEWRQDKQRRKQRVGA